MRKRLLLASNTTIKYIGDGLGEGRNVPEIALELKVAPSTLYAYIKEHNITYTLKYPRGVSEEFAQQVVAYFKANPYVTNRHLQKYFGITNYVMTQILTINGADREMLNLYGVNWTPMQQEIIRVYNLNTGNTFTAIARTVGTTRMSVSRVVRKYLEARATYGDSK